MSLSQPAIVRPLLQTASADEQRAEYELYEFLGLGRLETGRERLSFWLSWFLPETSARTGHAVWRPQLGWRRFPGRPSYALLLAHFRGELALGGVYRGSAHVLCIDVDNQAGKSHLAGEAPASPVDADLEDRLLLAIQAFPEGTTVRSGPSGGYHRWVFLSEDVPLAVLHAEARRRLQPLAKRHPKLAAGIEVHPTGAAQSHGGTLRAPFGCGSLLLGDGWQPSSAGPGEAIQRLMDRLATRPPLSLAEAFPGQVPEQLPLDVAAPIGPRPVVAPAPRAGDESWIALIKRCSGLLAKEDRPDRLTYANVMERLAAQGIPRDGVRHQATHLMALRARWLGRTQAEAEAEIVAWVERSGQRSRDYRRDSWSVVQSTRRIVANAYRPEAPKASTLPRRPVPIRVGDARNLDQLFPGDGEAVAVAAGVLAYTAANGQPCGPGSWAVRLPLARIEVVSRGRTYTLRNARLRRAFERVLRSRLLVRIGPRQYRNPAGHPDGIRMHARLYRVFWEFAEGGAPLQPLRRRSGLKVQPAQAQSLSAKNEQIHEGGVQGGVGGEGVSLPQRGVETSPECPVGAVGGEAVQGPVGDASELGFEARLPQARQLPQGPTKHLHETEGLWHERWQAPELGERGSGGEGSILAWRRRRTRQTAARGAIGNRDGREDDPDRDRS